MSRELEIFLESTVPVTIAKVNLSSNLETFGNVLLTFLLLQVAMPLKSLKTLQAMPDS
jgi:hypothetical protein